MQAPLATDVSNLDLQRVIRMIPNYDPFAQAGDCWFDEEAAQFAVDFIQQLCHHVKGPLGGQLIRLEPWQQAIIANLWGWKRQDGYRRFREAMIYVGRGNSKTTLAAALTNLSLFTDQEPGAELYSSAADRDQARLCFQIVSSMIRAEPELERRAEIYRNAIVVDDRSYKAISAEAGTKHGFNVHFLVNDELHAHRTPELTEVLMTGMGKRTQPMAIHITTADYERENSICNQKYDYAKQVAANSLDKERGICDPAFLPVIYEATVQDDWTDPKVWKAANPNLGISIPLDYFEREYRRAVEDMSYRSTFWRLHLNIRTKQRNRWIDPEKWYASAGSVVESELLGELCGGGLDLSSKYDLTVYSLVFPRGQGVYAVLPRFYIPEEAARERERKDRIPYSAWASRGYIKITRGASVDYDLIEEDIKADFKRFRLRRMAFDPWNANATRTRLEAFGIEMVEFPQHLRQYNEPTKEFGRLIMEGKLHHGNHPVLNWNADNVEVYTDANGNIRPVKAEDKSANKVDGIQASIMGLWAAMGVERRSRSYYADNPITFVW